jgi:hypothetical protein
MLALIVMMLAGIDTTFYIWIMMSLNNILISLAARKQAAKHQVKTKHYIFNFFIYWVTFLKI